MSTDKVLSSESEPTESASDSTDVASSTAGEADVQSQPVDEAPSDSSASPGSESDSEAATDESTVPPQPQETAVAPDDSAETSAEPERRRPRLNPTVNTDAAKAVPTLLTGKSGTAVAETQSAVAPAGEPLDSTAASTESLAAQALAAAGVNQDPVELPPKIDDLDADLEAEIAAAVSDDDKAAAAAEVADTASSDEQAAEQELEEGSRVTGKVQSIHADNVFLDLGHRSPGIVQLRQFDSGKHPAVGQDVEVVVESIDEAEGLVHVSLPRGVKRVGGDWSAVSVGQTVDCMVTKTNKGGLEVSVSSLRGFMPAGQVDLNYISDLEPFIGQKLRSVVLEINPKKRNLVVSRRAFLDIERKEAEEVLWAKLDVGQKFFGTIKTIKDYGAFVDIGGVDGFLHIGEISWSRINHPTDVIHEGQAVEVKVISLDNEKKRIGLGMRQMMPNPWKAVVDKYAVGSTVSGKVTRTAQFGAFVELEPGVEGLVHISELDYRRVKSVAEVLKVDQEIDVQVLEVDPDRKRISLSLKALQPKPEIPEAKTKAEQEGAAESAAYVRKQKGNLKGGTGSQSPGGMFGNPKDF